MRMFAGILLLSAVAALRSTEAATLPQATTPSSPAQTDPVIVEGAGGSKCAEFGQDEKQMGADPAWDNYSCRAPAPMKIASVVTPRL